MCRIPTCALFHLKAKRGVHKKQRERERDTPFNSETWPIYLKGAFEWPGPLFTEEQTLLLSLLPSFFSYFRTQYNVLYILYYIYTVYIEIKKNLGTKGPVRPKWRRFCPNGFFLASPFHCSLCDPTRLDSFFGQGHGLNSAQLSVRLRNFFYV